MLFIGFVTGAALAAPVFFGVGLFAGIAWVAAMAEEHDIEFIKRIATAIHSARIERGY